jgi:hypothetical protein
VFAAAAFALIARADTITIDFENVPSLASGPVLFSSAGPAQTLDVSGAVTISGGVVLDLASTLTGNPYATAPNIYATASDNKVGTGGFGLPSTITIDTASGTVGDQATVPVINGMNSSESYIVTAFDGGSQVSQQIFSNVQAFGFAVASFTGIDFTSITITPTDASSWDFATDSISLSESATRSILSTPEPASAGLVLAGLFGVWMAVRFRRRAASARGSGENRAFNSTDSWQRGGAGNHACKPVFSRLDPLESGSAARMAAPHATEDRTLAHKRRQLADLPQHI